MKIYKEQRLADFEFWSGGYDRAKHLTEEDFDLIEPHLEEIAPEEGYSDTHINDLFWFDFDFIAQILGYEDEEDFFKNLEQDEDDE